MKCDDKVKNRIKRSEGQLRGILKMMEEEKDCENIVTQLSAVRSSIDQIIALITINNLKQLYEQEERDEQAIDKAINLLMKSR